MSFRTLSAVLATGFLVSAALFSACANKQSTVDRAVAPSFAGPFEGRGELERPVGPYVVASVSEENVPARDGVLLATDVYLPAIDLPTEAILIRTPYDKEAFAPEVSQTGTVATFVEHGYAVLVQDVRGKHSSEGTFAPLYRDDVDSYDTMDWITSQDWSNGVVGTFGCSYLGETQVASVHLRHAAWKAAIPMSSSGANGGVAGRNKPFAQWNGGAFELAMGLAWFKKHGFSNGVDAQSSLGQEGEGFEVALALSSLPVSEALSGTAAGNSAYSEFVINPPGSLFWDEFPYLKGDERVSVPALFIASWNDYGPRDVLAQLDHFREHSGALRHAHRVVIDPGLHCDQHKLASDTIVGARSVGDARFDFFGLYLNWFDHWLRGADNGATKTPLVTYFRMGDNRWRTAPSWPVPETTLNPYYFTKSAAEGDGELDGRLSTKPPEIQSSLDYVYDPADPLPTLGAPVCCTNYDGGESLEGAFDQSANVARPDVLIFETDPLGQAVDVTGPISVILFVSSDAPDTDFTAKLLDVYPDGRAFNVVDGIQRMRWRNGFDAPAFLEPGEIYEVEIDLQATSNLFLPGHRIRVEISSSNFPRFSRNLNTGEPNHSGVEFRSATNSVHIGGVAASHILLPIVGESAPMAWAEKP